MAQRKSAYPKGFYVYKLCDPRDDLPFYVGKGCGSRRYPMDLGDVILTVTVLMIAIGIARYC